MPLAGPPGGYQAAPLSSRKAQSLDMSTVERRNPAIKENPKRIRPHGLTEAPTFTPTPEEFKDPMEYIRSIAEEGRKYGIVKIIPPESWQPEFGIDTEVRRSLPAFIFTLHALPCATPSLLHSGRPTGKGRSELLPDHHPPSISPRIFRLEKRKRKEKKAANGRGSDFTFEHDDRNSTRWKEARERISTTSTNSQNTTNSTAPVSTGSLRSTSGHSISTV